MADLRVLPEDDEHEIVDIGHLGRSRGEPLTGEILPVGAVTAACQGEPTSGAVVVDLEGVSLRVKAMEPIMMLAYRKGLRADSGLPEQIRQAVYVFNAVPEGEEALYERAALAAWETYCRDREAR